MEKQLEMTTEEMTDRVRMMEPTARVFDGEDGYYWLDRGRDLTAGEIARGWEQVTVLGSTIGGSIACLNRIYGLSIGQEDAPAGSR